MLDSSLYHEQETLRLISQGDAQAFARLFRHYQKKIYALAYRLTESTDSSEEIVQDVFLKIWLTQKRLPDIEHFENYLFIIARNHIYSYLRTAAKNPVARIEADGYWRIDQDTPESQLIIKESSELIQRAVSRLSKQQSEVYRLSKESGLSRDQIALQLNLSPETVKNHLARAMRSIRAYLLANAQMRLIGCIMLSVFDKG